MPRDERPPPGWHGRQPRTIAVARPTANLELSIELNEPEDGYVLTVLDLQDEAGEVSSHGTVEAAKVAASAATGIRDLNWVER